MLVRVLTHYYPCQEQIVVAARQRAAGTRSALALPLSSYWLFDLDLHQVYVLPSGFWCNCGIWEALRRLCLLEVMKQSS